MREGLNHASHTCWPSLDYRGQRCPSPDALMPRPRCTEYCGRDDAFGQYSTDVYRLCAMYSRHTPRGEGDVAAATQLTIAPSAVQVPPPPPKGLTVVKTKKRAERAASTRGEVRSQGVRRRQTWRSDINQEESNSTEKVPERDTRDTQEVPNKGSLNVPKCTSMRTAKECRKINSVRI